MSQVDNSIRREGAAQVPNVVARRRHDRSDSFSSIRLDDWKEFRDEISKRRSEIPRLGTYADAWLYITQACRNAGNFNLGRIYKTTHFMTGVGLHNDHMVLVRPVGKLPRDFISVIRARVLDATSNYRPFVYVKKATEAMRSQIIDHVDRYNMKKGTAIKFTDARNYPWDDRSPHDDDTYPERIIDLDKLSTVRTARGCWARDMRSKARQYERYSTRVRFSKVAQVPRSAIERMISDHFGDSYRNMITILGRPPKKGDTKEPWDHSVVLLDGEVVGLYAWERLDASSFGLYAGIAKRGLAGLGEEMVARIGRELTPLGVRYLNTGGSETAGLDAYKTKFPLRDGGTLASGVVEPTYPIQVLDFRDR